MTENQTERTTGGALGRLAGKVKAIAGDTLGDEQQAREGRLQEASADAELEAQRLAGRRHGAERRAVVGPVAGEDLEAVRLAAQLVVLADELEGELVGLRARVRVVRGALAAQQPVEALGELDRG